MRDQAETVEDGRVVLDDLPWDAISRRHGSRDQDQCRRKWFQQLSPSMVDRGAPLLLLLLIILLVNIILLLVIISNYY